MRYLTPEQVLAIHALAIKRYGGSSGIRELRLLESAVNRPRASFAGQDLYPTIFKKAAALLQSLLKNHPFIDGNKRTAMTATGVFLRMNGYKLINTHKEEVEFALGVDSKRLTFEKIVSWLKKNSKKIKNI